MSACLSLCLKLQCWGVGAGAGAAMSRNTWPELEPVYEVSAPGQTKVVYFIIVHFGQDQASELSRYSFQESMKNLLFTLKAVQAGTHKPEVGAEAETF
jgi:hypothetical protein